MLTLPLSDDAWDRVSHLLQQDSKPHFGRPPRNPRDVLNAILWVMTQGERWHHLPGNFPPSQTCYIKWLQWRRAGLMSTIFTELEIEGSSAAYQ
ncbi:transposase [Paraburkholderia sp. BCC1886]|uniref:transposase n=1 Tax=Paraburkholderia sp. BCC1886 TaxID=2562670 RepID=UPI0011827398|nr:transposase [Paraburkholderia sp. BCC1886]